MSESKRPALVDDVRVNCVCGSRDSERASSAYTMDQTDITPDERIEFLFQPDSLLSAHYFGTLRRESLLEPEKRLMFAILKDAIQCFQDNLFARNEKNRRFFEEAQEWIVETDGDWVFSFENICDALGFNPAYMRHGLLRWMANTLPKPHNEAASWDGKKMAK
jgi:hypothetical protein